MNAKFQNNSIMLMIFVQRMQAATPFCLCIIFGGFLLSCRDDSTKYDATKSEINRIAYLLDQFRQNNSRLPTNQEGLDILFKNGTPPSNAGLIQFSEQQPLDNWGRKFKYEIDNDKGLIVTIKSDGESESSPTDDRIYKFDFSDNGYKISN